MIEFEAGRKKLLIRQMRLPNSLHNLFGPTEKVFFLQASSYIMSHIKI